MIGCDASILRDSTATNQAEKDGPPNMSVRSFYVIDEAEAKLELVCPRTVSCVDIIAISARDVVAMVISKSPNCFRPAKILVLFCRHI